MRGRHLVKAGEDEALALFSKIVVSIAVA